MEVITTGGITLVLHQQTILVGLHQKAINLSTTHVQPVGVYLMVETMVYGQRRKAHHRILVTLTTVQTKV